MKYARLNLFLPFYFLLFTCLSGAQTLAPNAPGKDAQWATAGKEGVGTSATLESKVWFTLAQGVMTEVYYPDVTVANVHLLQFVVVNPLKEKVETEKDDAITSVFTGNSQSLTFSQTTKAKNGDWRIEKIYTTDPKRHTLMITIWFLPKVKGLKLYVYYDPSLNNSGMHDTAWNEKDALVARDEDKFSALISKGGFDEMTNGFYQVNDGLEQLKLNGKILKPYARAENGNVVQLAHLRNPVKDPKMNILEKESLPKNSDEAGVYTISLGFGKTKAEAVDNAQSSLNRGFYKCLEEYEAGWQNYLRTIQSNIPNFKSDSSKEWQFNFAAMLLKAHEDKTHRGANIASLSIPWGGDKNANENTVGGYHLVWSRDLYHVATAFMALGDKDAAIRALNFLFKVQQKPDGSFPQNSFLDGKPFWGSLQLDEVAYPLILAYQLRLFDKATWENHVKRAADFLVKTGPKTPQERWEEKSGFSPSTIAAEIAGLVCAAHIAKLNGDESSAVIYLATADDWARKVEMWTTTTNGKYGDGNYYIRLTDNGKPDALEKTVLNNNGGTFIENEIVDAGFLELVRLGIKSPDDPLIVKSLKVVDEVIKVNTPNGEGFYRYNHDGYGEMDDGRRWNWDGKYTGKGRLWALLSGERGQYELALSDFYRNQAKFDSNVTRGEFAFFQKVQATKRFDAMVGFAGEGYMIPEQVWDRKETPSADRQFVPELKFGEKTGSAAPLAWSMAQFIRLAVNLQAGKNLDTPDIVYSRYVKNAVPEQTGSFGGTDQEIVLPVKAGEKFIYPRSAPKGTKIGYIFGGKTNFIEVGDEAKFSVEVIAPEKEEIAIIGVLSPDGSTAFERVKVSSLNKIVPQNFSAETIEKIKNAKQSPLIENGKAILFYRGDAKNVTVAGDLTGWEPGRIFMQKIAENLFAVQIDLALTARTEYKFIVDGKWIADALNPNKLDNGVGGENSFFAMPEYKSTEWDKDDKLNVEPTNPNEVIDVTVPPSINEIEVNSKQYGKKNVKIYLPDGYESQYRNKPFPVIYFQDGNEYLNQAKAIQIQRNLVKAGKIKPFIMVFLAPKDRMKEYWASDDYAKFVATEVVPAIDAKYNTIKTREGRAILGASLGGITSVWVGLKYPEIFSKLGGQSSSFWIDNGRVVKELEKLDANKTKFKFYFDDGALEGAEDTRRVNVMLRAKGYPVTYVEGETGHNWTSWRDRLAEAFVALVN
jgi:glucoamylase